MVPLLRWPACVTIFMKLQILKNEEGMGKSMTRFLHAQIKYNYSLKIVSLFPLLWVALGSVANAGYVLPSYAIGITFEKHVLVRNKPH